MRISAALRAGGSRDRRSRAAAPARLAVWCIRRAPPRGIQSRPIGGSVRCQTPSQVLPLPSQSRQYRRARTGRPVGPVAGGTDARHPATARHAPDPEASSPSMMSVSTGRSHRKDVVSEHGGEPVWHDFPEEAPRWLRESSPPTRILTGTPIRAILAAKQARGRTGEPVHLHALPTRARP